MLLPPPSAWPIFAVGVLSGLALLAIPMGFVWIRRAVDDSVNDIYRQMNQECDRLNDDIIAAEDRMFKILENTSEHMRTQIEVPLSTAEAAIEDHTTQIADLQTNLNELRLVVEDVISGRVFKSPDAPIAPPTKRARRKA